MRSTIHWPAGGVQSSEPSGFHLRREVENLALAQRVGAARPAASPAPRARRAERRPPSLRIASRARRCAARAPRSGTRSDGGGSGRSMSSRRWRWRGHERHAEEPRLDRRKRDRVLLGRAARNVDDLPEGPDRRRSPPGRVPAAAGRTATSTRRSRATLLESPPASRRRTGSRPSDRPAPSAGRRTSPDRHRRAVTHRWFRHSTTRPDDRSRIGTSAAGTR